MSLFLGIDVGTTKTAAVVVDTKTGSLVAWQERPNDNRLGAAPDRSEWDAHAGLELAMAVSCEAAERARSFGQVEGIGVTGQMHGVVVVDEDLEPRTPFIGWQDKRCDEPTREFDSTIAQMRRLASEEFLSGTGCRFATGYMGPTLFWLAQNGLLPSDGVTASFMPDYVVAWLCQQRPVTDPTDAASAGVYDLVRHCWHEDLLRTLGLPLSLFPAVLPTGSLAGRLAPEPAKALGLPAGLPVMNALGDNQSSFFGSVASPAHDLLINIGTGGQISATVRHFVPPEVLETRPFVGEDYLLVGAGMTGGNAYAAIRDFVLQIGEQVFGVTRSGDLYAVLNRLAEAVAPGSEGLQCDPRFAGTRHMPWQRGSFTGISPANFTIGHFVRALFEGMAETFWSAYVEMQAKGLEPRQRLVGSGNGIRRNPLLAHILAERFGLPLVTPVHTQEAAYGAALLAAVAAGAVPSLSAAGSLIRYLDGKS